MEIAAILKKCESDLPCLDIRPERKAAAADEEEILTASKVFPNDGGRIM